MPEVSQTELVQTYLNARQNGDHNVCLDLLSEEIILTSARDGTVKGKDNFGKYLKQTKANGNFSSPIIKGNLVEVSGTTKIVGLKVNIVARFEVENEKIRNITISRK
mmetsp:Transcript_11653/g.35566  ORF Transcript_11653/g.35566 Transcript_11653/m.35566 type:complete len:107 (-) Transcript_11653:159-479(-)